MSGRGHEDVIPNRSEGAAKLNKVFDFLIGLVLYGCLIYFRLVLTILVLAILAVPIALVWWVYSAL